MLDCAALDWSGVSPAIFGAMFQSVMDEKARRNLGAHYPFDEDGELAALTLIEAWWDELQGSKLLNMKGGPRVGEVKSVLESLSVADPMEVMSYLIEVDGKAMLNIKQLRELDGNQIAHEMLKVVVLQIVHATSMPRPADPKR